MTTDQELAHAHASVEAVKAEQALITRAQHNAAQLTEASQAYAQCVTVVAALQDDITMLTQEHRQLALVRDDPRRYGVTKWKANMQYRECGRELRKAKIDVRYAIQAERRALKIKDKYEAEQRRIAREQTSNTRLQERLGLIPKPARTKTIPALVELAQYTGLLDGSF